ncbi:glycosyltransferase, partial [Desulfosarcina sp. OttesenSCG-928-G17]|nr:glycosyltransferase [Desulfosarcina sp. OttesenSCG-928-G17]
MVPEPDTGKVKRSLRVVVAGGGTGGHLFPGIAVANAFMDTNEKNRVLFIGPGRPFEIEALALAGFPQKTLSVEGIKGRRIWDKGRAMAKIPLAISQAMTLLGREGADLVVSVGGYAAGPVGLAAWLKG